MGTARRRAADVPAWQQPRGALQPAPKAPQTTGPGFTPSCKDSAGVGSLARQSAGQLVGLAGAPQPAAAHPAPACWLAVGTSMLPMKIECDSAKLWLSGLVRSKRRPSNRSGLSDTAGGGGAGHKRAGGYTRLGGARRCARPPSASATTVHHLQQGCSQGFAVCDTGRISRVARTGLEF